MYKTKMNNNLQENICRLCLKEAENKIEIDDIVKQMFEILLIRLDLGITKNSIICQDCMEVGKKCLRFKFTCVDTEKFILPYSAYRKEVKHDIKVIYEEGKHMRLVFDEHFGICRICMTRMERNNFISFDTLTNERMFEMLPKYMVEMDFDTIENPIICANCKENLDGYVKFLIKCLDIEEKIKAYCIEEETDRSDKVKLSDVLQFMSTDILEYPNNCSQTCKIKQGHKECAYPEAYKGLIKQEELDIKDEGTILNEKPYRNCDKFLSKKYNNETESDMISLKTKKHNTGGHKSSNMRRDKHATCTNETKETENIKTVIQKDTQDFQSNVSVDRSVFPMFRCSFCSYESKYKSHLKRHMLVHRDVPEISIFKCSLCTYESKYKSSLKYHMLVHKDVSEVKIFRCSFCCFESKHKGNLKTHMMLHKDVLEIKMIKCSLCAYQCKHKSNLKFHMLSHKDVSEIETFKCSFCAYETKRKVYFNSHMMVHKDISEINMFKCKLCSYESKRKCYLKSHMLVHKNVSEREIFKCTFCGFETRQRRGLKSHMLVHADVSEIKMFKCSLCTYEGKRKRDLNSHMKVHMDVSEIEVYKCKLCCFECKRKHSLERHILIHKDVSEVKMFKCELCHYESKHKSDLKSHMLVHQNVSEIKMFKCPSCTYETKRKGNLNTHMMVHKDVSEIKMLKCKLCSYESKRKVSFNKHMLVHKDDLETKMLKS